MTANFSSGLDSEKKGPALGCPLSSFSDGRSFPPAGQLAAHQYEIRVPGDEFHRRRAHERFPGRFGRRDFHSHRQTSLVHWRTTKQIAFTGNSMKQEERE